MAKSLVAVLVAMLLGAGDASAEPSATPQDLAGIRQQMDAAVANHKVASISAAVIRDGRVIWMQSSGWADIEARRPATPDTIYRLGSISKSITSTVAAIAARDGLIDLASPITRYLPALGVQSSGQFRQASLTDLLAMTAGMSQAIHYRGRDGDVLAIGADALVRDYAVAIPSQRGRFSYSNLGPELVSRAIAARAGRPFDRFAAEELFAPLGMTGTVFRVSDVKGEMAKSYRSNLTPLGREFEIDPAAGAGALSPLRDVASYAVLHLTGAAPNGAKPLTLAELAELHRPRVDGVYGFGWGTIGVGDNLALVSDGEVLGGESIVLLAPNRREGVVVLSNSVTDQVAKIALAAMETMAPGYSAAFAKGAAAMEAERARNVEAYYPPKAQWSAAGSVVVSGNRLRLAVSSVEGGVTITLGRLPPMTGQPSDPDAGYAVWKTTCPAVLPACRDGTDADATLNLTRTDRGLAGALVVTSRLGSFPYAVRLSAKPMSGAR